MNVGRKLAALALFLTLTAMAFAESADIRIPVLTAFLDGLPVKRHAIDFIRAADRYHLDWRLLPCLSIVESSGGKRAPYNNIFGWNSGHTHFSSIAEAIYTVASRLAEAPFYRGKTISQKLSTYNQADKQYSKKIWKLMSRLADLHSSMTDLLADVSLDNDPAVTIATADNTLAVMAPDALPLGADYR